MQASKYPSTASRPLSIDDRRHRKIALAATTSLASRVSGLLLAYLSVSLGVGKMGTVNFGLWMAVNSLAVLLPFADFGLGNGLTSYVSRRIGEDRLDLVPSAVASCLYWMIFVGFVVAAGGTGLSRSGLLSYVFVHQSAFALRQIAPAATAFFVCLGLTMPLTLVEKLQMAAQDAHITSAWQIVANLTTCLTVYLVSREDGSLCSFVLVYSGTPLLAKAINFSTYFLLHRKLAPSMSNVDWQTGRHLLKCGASFVLLQSSVAIGYTCDNLILAAQSGAASVAMYDVVQRLFSLTVVTELSIAPLWGAFGEALGRGDFGWVRKTFYRSILFNGSLCVIIGIALVASGPTLVKLWTHGRIQPSFGLLLVFAAWRVLNVIQGNFAALLNHEVSLSKQTLYFGIAALTSFALKIPLLTVLGTPGIVLATLLAFGLIYVVPSIQIASGILQDGGKSLKEDLVAA